MNAPQGRAGTVVADGWVVGVGAFFAGHAPTSGSPKQEAHSKPMILKTDRVGAGGNNERVLEDKGCSTDKEGPSTYIKSSYVGSLSLHW